MRVQEGGRGGHESLGEGGGGGGGHESLGGGGGGGGMRVQQQSRVSRSDM